jgi:hypothetical protein
MPAARLRYPRARAVAATSGQASRSAAAGPGSESHETPYLEE